MFRPRSNPLAPLRTAALAFALVLGAGCDAQMPETPTDVGGVDVAALKFHLHSENMGIFPDRSVLEDPNNPFAKAPLGATTKWQVNDTGGDVAAFYAWATELAYEPTGEHQYYAARRLADIHANGEAAPDELPKVKAMAIRAYQALLDSFPDSATFDATGKIPYRLAPLAYRGIIDLGGTVQGGWMEIQTPNGTDVVRIGAN